MALGERLRWEASPSAALLDSQSVKSTARGGKDEEIGCDAGKKLKSRKIHALVDSEGLPMRGRWGSSTRCAGGSPGSN